jgi:hypothetical protein
MEQADLFDVNLKQASARLEADKKKLADALAAVQAQLLAARGGGSAPAPGVGGMGLGRSVTPNKGLPPRAPLPSPTLGQRSTALTVDPSAYPRPGGVPAAGQRSTALTVDPSAYPRPASSSSALGALFGAPQRRPPPS